MLMMLKDIKLCLNSKDVERCLKILNGVKKYWEMLRDIERERERGGKWKIAILYNVVRKNKEDKRMSPFLMEWYVLKLHIPRRWTVLLFGNMPEIVPEIGVFP